MNIQAVICSFVLAIGGVLVCVTTRTDDGEVRGHAGQVVQIIGIIMVVIGGCGYLFTIYEVIRRGHEKLSKGHMRKLEKQVYIRQESSRPPAEEGKH